MFKWIYKWTDKIKNYLSEKGQGMTEYALILAAVALIAVVAVWGTGKGSLKSSITNAFTKASTDIDTATNEGGTPTPTDP